MSDECIPDREEQIKYLGNMRVVIYTAEQFIDQEEFGPESVVVTSNFWVRQADPNKPSWIDGKV